PPGARCAAARSVASDRSRSPNAPGCWAVCWKWVLTCDLRWAAGPVGLCVGIPDSESAAANYKGLVPVPFPHLSGLLPLGPHPAVAEPVKRVDREADDGPDAEQAPRPGRKEPGDAAADHRAEHARSRRERHAEGTFEIGARVPQYKHADAHDRERQQDAHRDELAENVEREQAGDRGSEDG